jgi:hypothetical protein
MENVASRLEDLEVTTSEGGAVRLGTLWAKKPAVLVFVRHFG